MTSYLVDVFGAFLAIYYKLYLDLTVL
jgi:hypothetical protein